MPQMGMMLIITLLPLQMLSGGLTPRESMRDLVPNLMLATPTSHFVALAKAILYRAADFSIVWPQFLALIPIGSGFFALALTRRVRPGRQPVRRQVLFPPDLARMLKGKTNSGQPLRPQG